MGSRNEQENIVLPTYPENSHPLKKLNANQLEGITNKIVVLVTVCNYS